MIFQLAAMNINNFKEGANNLERVEMESDGNNQNDKDGRGNGGEGRGSASRAWDGGPDKRRADDMSSVGASFQEPAFQ